MKLNTVPAMGFEVFNGQLSDIDLEKPVKLVNTISPNSYGMTTKDKHFRDALKGTDVLVLDGVYFGLAGIFLQGSKIAINNGPSVFKHFIERLNKRGGRVFFLGSKESTLEKIRTRLSGEYPNIDMAGHSPPYKPEFTEEDSAAMIEAINAFKPDVVFIGMTAPKQEKWAYDNYKQLDACIVASIGAVFDWYAQNEREIAPIWWKLHLAWLIRTYRRPEILKRYPNIGIYFWHLILGILRIKKF